MSKLATEVVEIKFQPHQNEALELSFQEFYKLSSAPRIERSLVVEKETYNKFVKSRMKVRTPFESKPSEVDLAFDAYRTPFAWIQSITGFKMPSGRILVIHEYLDEPNGMTEKCVVTEDIGTDVGALTFMSYFQAEQHVLERFLKEIC